LFPPEADLVRGKLAIPPNGLQQLAVGSVRSIARVLFGLVFTALGVACCYFLIVDYAATIETYSWHRVPAVIDSLTVTYPKHAPAARQDSVQWTKGHAVNNRRA
jgi:hypothetical protein